MEVIMRVYLSIMTQVAAIPIAIVMAIAIQIEILN